MNLKSKLKDMNRGMGIGKGKGWGKGKGNDRGKGWTKGNFRAWTKGNFPQAFFYVIFIFGILNTFFLPSHHKIL